LFRVGVYKPNQGRVVRQLSFLAIAILAGLAAFELHRFRMFDSMFSGSRYVFLLVFGVVALWFSYRIVNYSRFADFLIAVEAEMNKVSWPTKQELWNASLVVIFVIFAMAGLLFLFDLVWTFLFQTIGIRYNG
jgi:preprotein translocase subunit SecE